MLMRRPSEQDRSFLCPFLWLSGAKKEGCRDLPDERAGRRLWPDPLSGCQPEKTSASAGISGRGAMLIREGKRVESFLVMVSHGKNIDLDHFIMYGIYDTVLCIDSP